MAQDTINNELALQIDKNIKELNADKVLIVTDLNVAQMVIPKLSASKIVSDSACVLIPPGEDGKNLESVIKVWDKLEEIGATRKSLIFNIGGGVVTDLGGFAAATFKRGIRTINLPTTLLAAVDAASGGKTGVNYKGLKNEIGAFHEPSNVIISSMPFSTLPWKEMLSGYAEMIKTALISDRDLYIRLLDIQNVVEDEEQFGEAIEQCVLFKDAVVKKDPKEEGLRKILNFGHTAGHAFESLRMKSGAPVTHGHAVAHGILVALILSHIKLGFPSFEIHHYSKFLKENYGPALIECSQVQKIIEIMGADKKNRKHGQPLFTLLKEIGYPKFDCIVTPPEIKETLEIYRDIF